MQKQARRGFTLPEILVTVTVVAVLAAVVVPAVTQYVNKGNAPSTQGDLEQIRTAITSYVADNRVYPASLYDLISQPVSLTGTTSWKGPYTSAPLSTTGTAATFLSSGLRINLGPNISTAFSSGFLATEIRFVNPVATCQDLWDLDKVIDGGTGNTTTGVDSPSSTSGMITWTNSGCPTGGTTINYGTVAPLVRLMAVGS